MNRLIFGNGTIGQLSEVLASLDGPVLLLSGGKSFFDSGAAAGVGPILSSLQSSHSVVEGPRPTLEEAASIVSGYQPGIPGVLLAVGGGLVMDVAKLSSLLFANEGADLLSADASELSPGVRIVAVPTTAGSGSERTPFAVAYRGLVKHSVSHPSIEPTTAIVDPLLSYSMNPVLTATSGLDVLAHAIEASWAVSSTPASLELSIRALDLVWRNLELAVEAPDAAARVAMALASTTAGAAIASAMTTAPHALSYHLTAVHGVPHGAAAALTLGALLRFNSGVSDSDAVSGVSPSETIRRVDDIVRTMGAKDVEDASNQLTLLIDRIGMPTRLGQVGVRSADDVQRMARSVNSERLSNNPRQLEHERIVELLRGML